MDFALNEIQTDIQALADSIFKDLSAPDALAKVESQPLRMDLSLWSALQEAGLDVVALSEEWGGAGLSFLEACLVIEKLGRYSAPVPLITHTLATLAVAESEQAMQLERLQGSGAWLTASTCHAQTALRIENGLVSGTVSNVPYAQGARGLVAPVVAPTPSLVLIDPSHAGIEWQSQTSTALEPQAYGTLTYVPAIVIGGDEALKRLRLRELAAHAMAQLGVVDAAMALAREHVCEREQFGVKIGSFQAVSHRLADCWIDAMNLRTMALNAASRLNHALDAQTELDVYAAQSWACEAGHRVLASCQHVCGGLGHDRDYPMWRYAVWSRHYEMMMGGNELVLEQLGKAIALSPESAML